MPGFTLTRETAPVAAEVGTVVDVLGLTDTVTRPHVATRPLVDTVGALDGLTLVHARTVDIVDVLGLTDTADRALPGLTRDLVDALDLTDQIQVPGLLLRLPEDTLAVADAVTLGIVAGIADALGLGDTTATSLAQAIVDPLGVLDPLTRQVARSLAENLGLSDFAAARTAKAIVDNLGVLDTATGTVPVGIAKVETVIASPAATTTPGVVWGSTPATGELLTVLVGNTNTIAPTAAAGWAVVGAGRQWLAYRINDGTETTTCAPVTVASSNFYTIGRRYTGVHATALRAPVENFSGTGTAITGGTTTGVATAGDLVIGGASFSGAPGAFTADAAWADAQNPSSRSYSQQRLPAEAGTQPWAPTWATSRAWHALIAMFRPAGDAAMDALAGVGGFEGAWTGDDPPGMLTTVAGTSTVAESADARPGSAGTKSMLWTNDASSSAITVDEVVTLIAGATYVFKIWAKRGVASMTPRFWLWEATNANGQSFRYLKTDGTWATGAVVQSFPAPTTSWGELTFATCVITAPTSGTYNLKFQNSASVSATMFLDDATLVTA